MKQFLQCTLHIFKKLYFIIAYLIILESFQMPISIISYIFIISLLLLLNLKLIPVFQFHSKYLFRGSIGCFVLLDEQLCS